VPFAVVKFRALTKDMNNKVITSPVNMEERAKLGIRAGDTVRVWLKIEEKGKTRLQAFEGLVLARKHGAEAGGTFTVRKVSSGVGVEKIFPLHSPSIDKIEIVKRAKVRHAKLYFIRDKVAREVKRLLRRTKLMGVATKGATELEAERKVAEEEESARVATQAAQTDAEQTQNNAENNGETTDAENEEAKDEEPSVEEEKKEEEVQEETKEAKAVEDSSPDDSSEESFREDEAKKEE